MIIPMKQTVLINIMNNIKLVGGIAAPIPYFPINWSTLFLSINKADIYNVSGTLSP
jgi:hypothetical protein